MRGAASRKCRPVGWCSPAYADHRTLSANGACLVSGFKADRMHDFERRARLVASKSIGTGGAAGVPVLGKAACWRRNGRPRACGGSPRRWLPPSADGLGLPTRTPVSARTPFGYWGNAVRARPVGLRTIRSAGRCRRRAGPISCHQGNTPHPPDKRPRDGPIANLRGRHALTSQSPAHPRTCIQIRIVCRLGSP